MCVWVCYFYVQYIEHYYSTDLMEIMPVIYEDVIEFWVFKILYIYHKDRFANLLTNENIAVVSTIVRYILILCASIHYYDSSEHIIWPFTYRQCSIKLLLRHIGRGTQHMISARCAYFHIQKYIIQTRVAQIPVPLLSYNFIEFY